MFLKKVRSILGFTLVELLVVVSILSAMTAVAIPSVTAINKNIKMSELDSVAREIFLSAQSALIGIGDAGGLDAIQDVTSLCTEDESLSAERQALLHRLLPLSLQNAKVYIALDSGIVTAVYYSESDLPENVTELSKGDLRNALIGSYTADHTAEPQERLTAPTLTVVNGNTLRILYEYQTSAGVEYGLAVTVTELDSNNAPLVGRSYTFSPANSVGEILLDDPLASPPLPFSLNTEENITPGANIRVTAILTAVKGSVVYTPVSTSRDTNSLFGDKKTVDGKETVEISNARHLQNLEPKVSKVGLTSFAVLQTGDITWELGKSFTSIKNTELTRFNGQEKKIRSLTGNGGLFDVITETVGEQKTIANIRLVDAKIRIDGASNRSVGILANKAEKAVIENCGIYAENDLEHTGIISTAGSGGTTVYSTNVGGMIGWADACRVSDCFTALPTLSVCSYNVGGLVGLAGGGVGVYSRSYAAISRLEMEQCTSVGLLIGSAYASVNVDHCYATGKVSVKAGSFITSANGFAGGLLTNAENCYCVVSYEDGIMPEYGFANCTAAASCCYWKSANPAEADRAGILPITPEELSSDGAIASLGSTFARAKVTYAYSDALRVADGGGTKSKLYPYPALTNAKHLPTHYGDWEEQKVTDISVFAKEGGTTPAKIIYCPWGESIDFWAEPRLGVNAIENIDVTLLSAQPIYAPTNAEASLTVTPSARADGSVRTRFTLTSSESDSDLGVYYLDLTAGGAKLRVIVVVYYARIVLSADHDGYEISTIGTTQLSATPCSFDQNIPVTFTAGFDAGQPLPNGADVANGIHAVFALSEGIPTTLDSEKDAHGSISHYLSDWNALVVIQGDERHPAPGVTVNDGVLHDAGDNSDYFPYAKGGAHHITVEGEKAGTAFISAAWAMNLDTKVTATVFVNGPQVMIKTASAKVGDATTNSDNYPYLMKLDAKKNDNIRLTLTAGATDPSYALTGSFSWELSGGGLAAPKKGVNNPIVFNINDSSEKTLSSALYKIAMTYKYTENGKVKEFTDFMYVAVKRDLREGGEGISIYPSDDHSFTNEVSTITLEQIDWAEDLSGTPNHPKLNRMVIRANLGVGFDYANLQWTLKVNADDSGVTVLTGRDSPAFVSKKLDGDTEKIVASVRWSDTDVSGSHISGGVIIIDAIDYDYYGNVRPEFTIVASVSGSVETKSVTVRIMPKLLITPQRKVAKVGELAGWFGETTTYYNSNRTMGDNPNIANMEGIRYQWSQTYKGSTSGASTSAQYSVSSKKSEDPDVTINLRYGPYLSHAILSFGGLHDKDFTSSINFDVEFEKESWLIKKGQEKLLQLTWHVPRGGFLGIGTNKTSYVNKAGFPKPTPSIVTFKGVTATTNDNQGRIDVPAIGNSFGKTEIQWIDQFNELNNKGNKVQNTFSASYDAYVVGTEFSETEKEFNSIDTTATVSQGVVTLTHYYPKGMNRSITFTSDNPDILIQANGTGPKAQSVTVNIDSNDDSVGSVTLHIYAKSFGSAIIRATYTAIKDGKAYTDMSVCAISVVNPSISVAPVLEPCTEIDRATLSALFGARFDKGADKPLGTYAVYEDGSGTAARLPTLFCKENFGYNTMYYKAYLVDSNSETKEPLDLVHYIMGNLNEKIHFAPSDAELLSCESERSGNVYYIKVTARGGSTEGNTVKLRAVFDDIPVLQTIMVYEQPSVEITIDGRSAPVTDTSQTVTLQDLDEYRGFTLRAKMAPLLLDEDGEALDSLTWRIEYPNDSYAAQGFIDFNRIGNTATVVVNQNPSCKVAFWAQSNFIYQNDLSHGTVSSDAAAIYALVFQNSEE